MSDSSPIVFIVDDDPPARKAIARLIRSAGIATREFASAEEFLAAGWPAELGCLLLDMRMPGLSGLDLQKTMLAAEVTLPIIFLTGHADVPTSVRAMKAGAMDLLEKPVDDMTLLQAVDQAIARHRQARHEQVEVKRIQGRMAELTGRESEVLSLVVAGLLNKQVAQRLGITEKTVKVHRARVMDKMNAKSLADLVRMTEKVAPIPRARPSNP